jgi:TolA-binding protein
LKLLRRVSFLFVTAIVISAFSITSASGQAMTPSQIEPVETQPSGGWLFEAGVNYETGRTLISDFASEDLSYDNIRLQPFSLTYGLNDWIQFGAGIGYSMNSEDNQFGAVDEGGFEGITLSSRFQWNEYIATSLDIGAAGSDEVYPYSNDGFSASLNFPMQMSLGPGSLHGELGYTLNSGDATLTFCTLGTCSTSTSDRENYLNYGIGYVYEVNRTFGLSGEIQGNGATVDADDAERMLNLIIGSPIRITEGSHLKPAFTLGLADGSPDFALGLDYGVTFGTQDRYADESAMETGGREGFGQRRGQTTARAQRQDEQEEDPLVMPQQEQQQQTRAGQQETQGATDRRAMAPSPEPGQQQEQTGPTYNPERAAELAQQGRRAFENGNYQEAIDYYTRAAKNDPTNVEYQSNLGSLHYRQGNYEEARQHYQRAVQIDPRDYFSHLYLGAAHYQLGNTERAREHFNRVLEIQPGNEEAQQWLDQINQ